MEGRQPGPIAPNGVVVTDDMHDGAALAMEALAAMGGGWQVESRVAIPRVAPECYGTVDAWLYNDGTLRVVDYKYGWAPVEARDNWQLIAYAAGLLEGRDDRSTAVELTIIQPRPYHRDGPVRTWRVMGADLRPQINQLAHAAGLATSSVGGGNHYTTGAWCVGCKARHACPALATLAGVMVECAARPDLPGDAPPSAQGRELDLLDAAIAVLEARRSGLAAAVEARLQAGGAVPGWGLVRSRGRLAWTVEPEAVAAIGTVCGCDLSKPAVITPTQARKAGVPEELLQGITTRAESVKLGKPTTANMTKVFNHGS
jgi:hypothetical protein